MKKILIVLTSLVFINSIVASCKTTYPDSRTRVFSCYDSKGKLTGKTTCHKLGNSKKWTACSTIKYASNYGG